MKNLYTAHNYAGIIALWENAAERADFTEWDYVYVMNTYYNQKNYRQCLEVYRAFHAAFPESDKLDDKMGWSCYYSKIKGFDFETGNREEHRRQADYIITHSSQRVYSPKWFMVKYMIDHIGKGDFGPEKDMHLVLQYLDQIDSAALSTESNTYTDNEGHTVSRPSDKEEWYSERTKALLSIKDFEECIKCCDEGLEKISTFHNKNDCWFRYRKAEALFALERVAESRKCIAEIQARGLKHWVIYQLLYQIDKNENNIEQAMINACICALFDPSHEMRVRFYEDFAEFLNENGYSREGALHRRLILLIREEKEWSIKEKHLSWNLPEDVAALDKDSVINQLQVFWNEWRNRNKKYLTGTVSRLLAEGKSGFIESDDGKSYYFNARDFQRKKTIPREGMRVEFIIVDRLDKSKGVVKQNAVEIKSI